MNGHSSMEIDDELLYEIDVHIHRQEPSIYLFQYPIRPFYRKYDETSFSNARIKEKHSLVEMDLIIDPQSSNYYSSRGKQFADSTNNENGKQFFEGDRMDKQTIASVNSIDGACYYVGLFDLRARQLVLCPLKSITQLRPQFNYFDSSSASNGSTLTKETNAIEDETMNASDGEQSGSESEENKPELAGSLVTMKFAKKESNYHEKKRLQSYSYYRQKRDDDRWQDLMCIMNTDSSDAQRLRQEFLTKKKMDSSFNLPREPRLSNSILINRPRPVARSKSNQRGIVNQSVGTVPLDDSTDQLSSIDDKPSVVFRKKNPFSLHRNQILPYPSQTSNSTVFYVTSSVFDENHKSHFSSNQTLLSRSQIDQSDDDPSLEPMENQMSMLADDVDKSSMNSDDSLAEANGDKLCDNSDQMTVHLEKVRTNPNNRRCADCDAKDPTIANISWLLVICKKCAVVHRHLTSDLLHLQSLLSPTCDHYLIDLLHDYGNKFVNDLLENNLSQISKPTDQSSDVARQQYIRKKYLEKAFFQSNDHYTQQELNQTLYETVETIDYQKTLYLILLGANPNYSEKMFAVADHAKRHQQIKQMKIILANGGLSEFDLIKSNPADVNESAVYLATKHGVLKEFLTRYENDRLKVYPRSEKIQRCLFEIDLNNVLAICNQSVTGVSLKCRFTNPPIVNVNSQCILIVDEHSSSNEYLWVFPNELERSLWIREIIKRQYAYYQLIYTDFLLLMKVNIQEGMNAEKQQVITIVYSGRFVICSDTIFDEVDLRKYSSLTYQKSEVFTGIVLCLVSNRFLYLSAPILKLTDMLYSCLHQAIRVKSLSDLTKQILTSQNIPIIVERFINFIFEHGLQTKGIYRQAGHETKIKQLLRECLDDPFTSTLLRENYSEHDVANALKRFLRQLDIPLLGTRENYQAWLRSTVDQTMKREQLIQYYRALLKDLKQNFPIHYSTLRTMLIHIHTVALLSEINGMTLSNLIPTFAPCLISQMSVTSMNYEEQVHGYRKMSLDDDEFKHAEDEDDDPEQSSIGENSPMTTRFKRNQTFRSRRQSISSTTTLSRFPLSSSYMHVTPTIHADLHIMNHLCRYYRDLFDITDDEIEHEQTCIETLLSIRNNQYIPRKLDGAMISVYFESRADELNGYAMNIFQEETTADMILEKLLKQVDKADCFFWVLFEVIIDQNLERAMYSCENISEVLYRYRTYLSHELNRQATFVVKLNYIQFEKERLEQRGIVYNNQSIQCEYFDFVNQRWMPCVWTFERAVLKIYRVLSAVNDRQVKWKSNGNQPETVLSGLFDQQSLIYSWPVEEIYLYIGADCRFVQPFDMNEYRVLTILPPEIPEGDIMFGQAFRFNDRNQMFFWYLELIHVNGYDKWTRQASRTMPDGVNYLPLQNYHTPSSALAGRKKSDLLRNKLLAKSCHVASNFCRQLRK